jgi:hypothetical protein
MILSPRVLQSLYGLASGLVVPGLASIGCEPIWMITTETAAFSEPCASRSNEEFCQVDVEASIADPSGRGMVVRRWVETFNDDYSIGFGDIRNALLLQDHRVKSGRD